LKREAAVGANLCNNYSKLSIKEEVSFSGNTSLQVMFMKTRREKVFKYSENT
jgi:hypothetical protein